MKFPFFGINYHIGPHIRTGEKGIMDWISYEIEKIKRIGTFPFQVKMLFFSHQDVTVRKDMRTPEDMLEISIRLEPKGEICRDVINGHPIREGFPNLVWKKPGGEHLFRIDRARSAISFGYPAERIEDFRKLGMYPGEDGMSFSMTPEIERLTNEYRKLCLQLYTPGVADRIDWTCFHLYREILYSRLLKPGAGDDTERIRNIAVWLQMHYSEPVDLDELARANGFSRASFFRKWKQVFRTTPVQYVLDLKVDAAAKFLRETDMSVAAIVREINFSGTTAFHHRFVRHRGMTPDQYRKSSQHE